MSYRVRLSIRLTETDQEIYSDQILGNHCSFSDEQLSLAGFSPELIQQINENEGCYSDIEVTYTQLIDAMMSYYRKELKDSFDNQTMDEFKDYILRDKGMFFSMPSWTLIGSFPYYMGQIDVFLAGNYQNRNKTVRFFLSGG